jgi:membrane protein insertase Oxa1/YidC/SpoIIIJ
VAATVVQILMTRVTMKTSTADANASSKMMLWMMPLMTLWLGYTLPAALCVYWVAQSAFSLLQELTLNKYFNKILDREGMARPSMAIGIFVAPETPGNMPVCVFDHILDETDKAEGGSFTFSIKNEHIASMNPKFSGEKPAPYHAVPLKEKK